MNNETYRFDGPVTVGVGGNGHGSIVIAFDQGDVKCNVTFEGLRVLACLAYRIIDLFDGGDQAYKK